MTNETKMLTLEETINFYDFLRGKSYKCANGTELKSSLKLSPKDAFLVVYYLQEESAIIPNTYEKCDECDELFDTEKKGLHGESGFLCGCCLDAKLMRGELFDEKE